MKYFRGSLLRESLAFVCLLLVNFVTYAKHYRGKATFPWDFLGGYHAQAYGWYDLGSVFAPPAWFPWSDMGFPAFIAVQAGGWYLPLSFMQALGITYSVHAATVLQVLHVLFGALGAYALARRLGLRTSLALLAGVAYHFSATFFSNQQHVDIVRAAAWIPWILFCFHPAAFKRWWGVPCGGVVLSQFLISGYPGGIVATVYGCAIWSGMHLLSLERPLRKHYIMGLVATIVTGTLMAMPKWLPLVLDRGAGLDVEHVAPALVDPESLITFLMPYDTPVFGGDPTMRSFWLPLSCLWGIAYVDFKSAAVKSCFALVIFALFSALVLPHFSGIVEFIPGLGLSRFPQFDWRPLFHVGLCLLSALGWARVIDGECSSRRLLHRSVAACLVVGGVLLFAIKAGYDASSFARIVGVLMALSVILVLVPSASGGNSPRVRRAGALLAGLFLLFAWDGVHYYRAQPRTWRPTWDLQTELGSFAGRFDDFVAKKNPGVSVARRPMRFVYGSTPQDAVAGRNSSWYNQCWYMRTYCVFGYNNLKLSKPHKTLQDAISGPGGEALLNFVRRAGQVYIPSTGVDTIPSLDEASSSRPVVGDSDGIDLHFVDYSPGAETYRVTTQRNIHVIQNEIGWPGWMVSYCDTSGKCSEPVATGMTTQGLRTWLIPPGSWTVKLVFNPPPNLPGYLCLLMGILIAVGFAVLSRKNARKLLA